MTAIRRTPMARGRWVGSAQFAVILTLAIVASQGCCSTWCSNWCERQCPTPTPKDNTFAIAFVEGIEGETCLAGRCVCASPKTVRAGSGDTIRFVNATDIKVTVKPYPGVFTSDAQFEIDPKDTVVKLIKDTDAFLEDAVLPFTAEVHPPGNDCEGYPGPSIVWD